MTKLSFVLVQVRHRREGGVGTGRAVVCVLLVERLVVHVFTADVAERAVLFFACVVAL